MPRYDVTKLNVAIDRLLEVTQNPRHRFMLQLFARHRALEVAGRFEEIFAPEMMGMDPEYHFTQAGIHAMGQDEVTLKDGTPLSERNDTVRGTPENPMTRDEVVAKACDLINPVLGDNRGAQLVEKVYALEQLRDIRELRPLLQLI